jgi:hypothetical protein
MEEKKTRRVKPVASRLLRNYARRMLEIWGQQVQCRETPTFHRNVKNDALKEEFLEPTRVGRHLMPGEVLRPIDVSGISMYVGHEDAGLFRPADDPRPEAFIYLTVERFLQDFDEIPESVKSYLKMDGRWIWADLTPTNIYRDFARWVYVDERSPDSFRISGREFREDFIGELAMRIKRKEFKTVVEALLRAPRDGVGRAGLIDEARELRLGMIQRERRARRLRDIEYRRRRKRAFAQSIVWILAAGIEGLKKDGGGA